MLGRHVIAAAVGIACRLLFASGLTTAGAASPPAPLASPSPSPSPSPVALAPLVKIGEIALPDSATRFDYQDVDATTGRLYLSHMGAGKLVVIDLAAGKVVANVAGYPKVTGVLAVPAEGKVFASAAGSHEVVIADLAGGKVLARVPGADFPDGIAYAPAQHEVFVSDESGGKELVIDARSNASLGTIDLGGEAGNSHYDSASDRVWVTVQTKNELVAIDPATRKITGRFPLAGSDHPHGFTIDPARHLAYVSCEGNDTLLVVDLTDGKVLQRFDVTQGPDVLVFDADLKRLYVACEGGAVDVFQAGAAGLTPIGTFAAPNAHTVAVDPKSHRVYVALKNIGGKPVMWILAPPG